MHFKTLPIATALGAAVALLLAVMSSGAMLASLLFALIGAALLARVVYSVARTLLTARGPNEAPSHGRHPSVRPPAV